MHQIATSIEDNILHYIYFNNNCPVNELEKSIINFQPMRKENIINCIAVLEKSKLIFKDASNIQITDEGKLVVENFNSYDDYVSRKKGK